MSYNKELDQIIINSLKEAVSDGDLSITLELNEAVFWHDEIGFISGEFDCGLRGMDHNGLVVDSTYNIIDVMKAGVILVPEQQTYISDDIILEFEDQGYSRLPFNDNHVNGYKEGGYKDGYTY